MTRPHLRPTSTLFSTRMPGCFAVLRNELMFLSRNGRTIAAPLDEHASVFLRLAAGELDREGFRAWVSAWIAAK